MKWLLTGLAVIAVCEREAISLAFDKQLLAWRHNGKRPLSSLESAALTGFLSDIFPPKAPGDE